MKSIEFERFVRKDEERSYFTVSFEVPENVERMDVYYDYPRHVRRETNGVVYDTEANIIDLALNTANGEYVGASGSDRTHIYISAYESAQGYAAINVIPGTWEIIVGAYKVADGGVTVRYRVEFTEKTLRCFRGDAHMHTTGSDGTLSPEELVELCRRQGLDYLFITDHNNYSENFRLPHPSDITVMPGAEWTHYNGHAGFLGVQRPYRAPFCVNTSEQARAQIEEAHEAGAMIVINHPFCKPECGWKWGFDLAPFDAVEVWNGAMMLDNENSECLKWWHEQLCRGKRIPITGGSDFHRPGPLSLPGIPCTCVYAWSRCPEDILSALKNGRAYVKMWPDAPDVEAHAGMAILGGTAPAGTLAEAVFTGLREDDEVRQITDHGQETIVCPAEGRVLKCSICDPKVRFVRYEISRRVAKRLPFSTVLVSNPIYFDAE